MTTQPVLDQSSPIVRRALTLADLSAVTALHARVFGPGRFARTAYRVREGTPPVSKFCRGAFAGPALIAALRLQPVAIGPSKPHLLLGPLAVAPEYAGHGHGKALVEDAIAEAARSGILSIVLVGDLAYYERFGFAPVRPGTMLFPGPVNPARILARAIAHAGLDGVRGTVSAIRLEE